MSLVWTREPDGEYGGRPRYEYHATSGDRTYHIVWATDAGFGYTARDAKDYIHGRYSIIWGRALWRCKEACQKIEDKFDVK